MGKLLIGCKFDLKDVEYILSRNGTDVCLYMIDFGMSTFWKTQADLIKTCENLQIEPTLPSSKSNKYYNQFLSGFVEYRCLLIPDGLVVSVIIRFFKFQDILIFII